MSDIDEAMGISTTETPTAEPDNPKQKPKRKRSKGKPKPAARSDQSPSRQTRPMATQRIRQGQTCPKCSRGLIGVVRTRLYRMKNKRVVVLGCRNQTCFWDLDGDNERVTPINPGRPIDE